MSHASAPGKMILLGEYAVLERAPAIVSAVNKFARVTIEKRSGSKSAIIPVNLNIQPATFVFKGNKVLLDSEAPARQRNQFRYVEAVLNVLVTQIDEICDTAMEITIDTDAFYHSNGKKYGFGGSAALTTALIKGLFKSFTDSIPDKKRVFDLALSAHLSAQEKHGSGVDVAASVYGGTIRYVRDQEAPDAVRLPMDLHIQPVWTGKSASTSTILQQLEQRKEEDLSGYQSIIYEMGVVSEAGYQSLVSGNTSEFLTTISEYYHLMAKLSEYLGIPVISEEHESINTIALDTGVAYKPSGAGNGDIGIVFSDSYKNISAASDALLQLGFTPLPCIIVEAEELNYSNRRGSA